VISCSLPPLWLQDVLSVLGLWDQTSLPLASLASPAVSIEIQVKNQNQSQREKVCVRERERRGTRRIIQGKEKIKRVKPLVNRKQNNNNTLKLYQ